VPRSWVFSGLVASVTLGLLGLAWAVLSPGGWSVWEALIFACFAVNAPWFGLSAATGLAGLAIRLFAADPSAAVVPGLRELAARGSAARPVSSRTAVAVCVRDEDMAAVVPPLHDLLRGLAAAGQADRFAVAILSDTPDGPAAEAEEAALAAFAARHPEGAVRYRRRRVNTGYKAGNVMDFLDHHAEGFDFLLLLDADSRMTAEAVLRLVRIMEAEPGCALVQPTIAGLDAASAFQDLFGFGHRHGSRIWATGQAWWQDRQGPFWGHNALIRIAPFREHCRLPTLPDGSAILSHDHVEAARLHAAGWAVRVVPEDGGSIDEHPPHLIAFLDRDLRWAAGNWQYRLLLRARDLGRLGRFQMLQALLHYALSPLWLALLPLAALNAATGGAEGTPRGLLVALLAAGYLALHLPKLAGYAEALLRPGTAGGLPPGGRTALLRRMGRELAFTLLFEPIAAVDKTVIMLRLATGRRIGWGAQERRMRPVGAAEAWRRFWPHALAGAVLLALGLSASAFAALLLLPAVLGLLLVVPFCMATSKPHRDAGPEPAPEPGLAFGGDHALVSRTKHLVS
jgi:membrane glycosyltransferase